MNDIKNHHRVNDIFFGPLERPALQWLAAHTPAWVTPDKLTAVGVLGTLTVAAGYLLTRVHPAFLWLASLGFVINWYGDSLDGTLARFRHIERPRFGFYIDHVVDAFNEVIVVLSLGLSYYVRFEIACLALIGYLLLSNLVFINTCTTGEFKISYSKLGPTEVRVLLILANTITFFTGYVLLPTPWILMTFFDLFVLFITALLFFFSIQAAVVNTIKLRKIGE